MKERPILFSGPMVRAIREGRKTQTRRVIKPQPRVVGDGVPYGGTEFIGLPECPYGQPGDRLWVRETWGLHARGDVTDWAVRGDDITLDRWELQYRCDWGPAQDGCFWRPSIHMPRWASRITLEIVSVRVERLKDISGSDCCAEGCKGGNGSIPGYAFSATPREHYRHVWESINGVGSWDLNQWVWVVGFKEAKP